MTANCGISAQCLSCSYLRRTATETSVTCMCSNLRASLFYSGNLSKACLRHWRLYTPLKTYIHKTPTRLDDLLHSTWPFPSTVSAPYLCRSETCSYLPSKASCQKSSVMIIYVVPYCQPRASIAFQHSAIATKQPQEPTHTYAHIYTILHALNSPPRPNVPCERGGK